MQRRWIKFVLAAIVLFVLVIGLVPFLINADTFRPKIESELSSSLGRKVALGHLSLSLITGSLVANDISIADDSTFSSAPFLEAKQLHFGIELGQFLFHHLVQITNITIDSPAIHLIHNQNGTWNFSNIGSASGSTQAGSQQDSIIPSLTIAKLKIKDGSASALVVDGHAELQGLVARDDRQQGAELRCLPDIQLIARIRSWRGAAARAAGSSGRAGTRHVREERAWYRLGESVSSHLRSLAYRPGVRLRRIGLSARVVQGHDPLGHVDGLGHLDDQRLSLRRRHRPAP